MERVQTDFQHFIALIERVQALVLEARAKLRLCSRIRKLNAIQRLCWSASALSYAQRSVAEVHSIRFKIDES